MAAVCLYSGRFVVSCCAATASSSQRTNTRAPTVHAKTASSSQRTNTRAPTVHAKHALHGEPGHVTSRRSLLGLLAVFPFSAAPFGDHLAGALTSCDFDVVPSGLGFCDTFPGSGSPASQGMLIKANYVGQLEDGKVFDSSYDRGKPLTFRIGVGQVIKGWDMGILGGDGVPPMLTGGKRRLRIPPQLGYGDRGAGCRAGACIIPPNSVLLFDVEFLGKAF